MKKIIISGIFITAFAIVATIFYNNVNKTELNDLTKANIEALAEQEICNDEDNPLPADSGAGGTAGGGVIKVYCHAGGSNSSACGIAKGTTIGGSGWGFGITYGNSSGCDVSGCTSNAFSCCTFRCSCLQYSQYNSVGLLQGGSPWW